MTVLVRAVVLSALLPAVVAAQPTPARWSGTAEASGNLLYGAASQRVLSAAVGTQRLDERAELRFDAQWSYGDSRRSDDGTRDITIRNTLLRGSVDIRPQARITPFAFVTALSSLQQRIASRVNGGAGAKYTIWRPDSVRDGFAEDVSVSLAALAEHTRALRDATVDEGASDEAAGTRYRWSLRARYRRMLSRSLRFSHVTFYQPTFGDLGEYTLEASTTLAIPLRERVNLTITHIERIDSEATQRGAPSNRDGQVLFGVSTTF